MKSLFLDEVLVKHNPQAAISLFEGTDEAYRKSVAERALAWFKVSQRAARVKRNPWMANPLFAGEPSEREKKQLAEIEKLKHELPRQANDANALEVSRIAVLATCGMTEIRKCGVGGIPEAKHCLEVLTARKPKWLDKWMGFACEERPITHWKIVREMEKAGLATAVRESGYWRAMAFTLPQGDASLVEILKQDAELLDHHIWCMLDDEPTMSILSNPFEPEDWRSFIRAEMDQPAEFWREASERRTLANKAWHKTFIQIASDEVIDREKFKEKVLYWIARIGSDDQMKDAPSFLQLPTRIGWFVAIFEAFPFSDAEKANLLPRIIGLLTSKDTEVLRWALKRLSTYSNDSIPIDDLSTNMGSLFRTKGKDHGVEAIKYLKSLSDSRPDDRTKLACVALAGLEHPSQEVQKRALDFVEKQKLTEDQAVLDELRYRAESLSGLLRQRADKLLGVSASDAVADDGGDSACAGSTAALENEAASHEELESLKRAAAAINQRFRDVCGIDEALKAVDGEVLFASALELKFKDVPRIDAANELTPISDIDDLSYRLLHIFETGVDWVEIELCLDGIVRLAPNRPSDLGERLAPLRARAIELLGGITDAGAAPFAGSSYHWDLAAVCIAWTDRHVLEPQTGMNNPLVGIANFIAGKQWLVHYKAPWGKWTANGRTDTQTITAFNSKRYLAVAHMVAKTSALPLLATPTHKGGWIDPRKLVERIQAWENAKQVPATPDYIQALLRIAPDKREEALAMAESLRGELADSLRFALGGNSSQSMTKAEWWVAAGRARAPLNDFEAMAQRFPGLGPDAAIHATYHDNIENFKPSSTAVFVPKVFSVSPEFKQRDGVVLFPTELMHARQEFFLTSGPGMQGIWLQNREPYFACQVRSQVMNFESVSMFWEGTWEPVFDPDVSATGLALWFLALGLTTKQPDNARLACDALIACIDDGRIDGVIFGDVLASLLPTGRVTLVRWVRAFKDCARVSPLHLQVVRTAIERSFQKMVCSDTTTPIKLIELLHDLCIESGESISTPKAREYFESICVFSPKSKAGTLAKTLLNLSEGRAAKHHRKAAAMHALAARIARGQRYTRVFESPG